MHQGSHLYLYLFTILDVTHASTGTEIEAGLSIIQHFCVVGDPREFRDALQSTSLELHAADELIVGWKSPPESTAPPVDCMAGHFLCCFAPLRPQLSEVIAFCSNLYGNRAKNRTVAKTPFLVKRETTELRRG